MALCSNNKNPLQRSGTSQAERLLPALNPHYIKADERHYDDWIVFANSFSKFLLFFDGSTEAPAGDWSPFFTSDISSVLGAISVQEIDAYKQQIKERFDFLKDNDHEHDTEGLKTKLNELFSAVFTLSKAMDQYYDELPATLSLKVTLRNLISSKLAPALYRLITYYKAAVAGNYIVEKPFSGWRILNKKIIDAGAFAKNGTHSLSAKWITKPGMTWGNYFDSAEVGDSIFKNQLVITGIEDFLAIEHAANHNLFSSIFDQYLFAYTKFVTDAGTELIKTLGNWDHHQPHYALFLAFLKLFRFAQRRLNSVTKRHLNFYYSEVLRLSPKPAEPNKVHVIGELAKQVESYLLVKDTELKAGKDSLGKDVIYSLDNDAVFNKAKVALLKNVYKGVSADSTVTVTGQPEQNNNGRLFAAPVSNSEDGAGAELSGPNKEWHPYVHKIYSEDSLIQIALPKAQIGFAVASRYLYLTEGEREVHVKLFATAAHTFSGINADCWLTTGKGWYNLDKVRNSIALTNSSGNGADLYFKLAGDEPAVLDYSAKVHGGTYNVDVPVLKVYLTQDDAEYQYDGLKDITLIDVMVVVEVGMNITGNNYKRGLKTLSLANSTGTLDASKAFMPFGPQPTKDAAFIVGNKEIFSKKNCYIKLGIEWAGLPASHFDINYNTTYSSTKQTPTSATYDYAQDNTHTPYYPKVSLQFLQKGVWTDAGSLIDIFALSTPALQIFSSNPGLQIPAEAVDADAQHQTYFYAANSVNGFMRLVLQGDFGYKNYISNLSVYLLEKSLDATHDKEVPLKPVEPYTPLMQSLYISYTAQAELQINNIFSFNEREIQFFHIYPFGEAEQHKYLDQENDVYLLPQFKHVEEVGAAKTKVTYQHNGEFYIGIQNLQPKQAVSILFQVLEGSTDPQVAKPDNQLHWSIMSNNRWLNFGPHDVNDTTLALLQSGIVSFAIPAEATAANTVLPAGYIWLRAAISEVKNSNGTTADQNTAGAVCKLLSVDAQAAVATFQPYENADDFLDHALAAGSVSKLKTPDAAVKKISQPYPSFGGRPKESSDHFYIRVSERLRHKARAINIWDYEHLILEAFPEIYKVKCLNHTGLVIDDSDGKEYTNELMPGHVLIITIPVLVNRNDTNILKPFTNQDTLTKIETYLRSRISCFAVVNARQPLFEEVKISFRLRLQLPYLDFDFYAVMLQQAITRYLTPWAFSQHEDIQFGGKIYKSSLINFIEEQYFVDFITGVFMCLATDDKTDMEVISASTVRSILVSVPASKHVILQAGDVAATAAGACIDPNAPGRSTTQQLVQKPGNKAIGGRLF